MRGELMALTRRPYYETGDDFRLDYGELLMTFNERDFLERAEQAARQLNLIARQLDDDELGDLVEFICEGTPPAPARSALGRHLHDHWALVLLAEPKPVHWLRRLMFRGAWLDQKVKEGALEVRFADGQFEYWDGHRNEPIELAPAPDFSKLRYG